MKLVIVDYGMGNIKSIIGALKYLKVREIIVSNNSHEILSADKLILPGVGSFSVAMHNIKELRIDKCLKDAVLVDNKPILGICLGMQLMGESSTEGLYTDGLGFIKGMVSKFSAPDLKIPHVGFNQVSINKNTRLFKNINDLSDFYFVHSFKMSSSANISQSLCTYDNEFIAAYEKGNIAGVQFHPELSQINGLKLLDNFIKYF
ncbi:imidazole glycerol phosphate synthase subunit HisH [bacterium]|jgi:imidazole glycerol-phosphate synthase subunit HisH|nr:imidazole glycerol phosphate synthase subunit HisH [bacterium]